MPILYLKSPLGFAGWERGYLRVAFRFCGCIRGNFIKTIVYVDGFNLYYRLKKTPYKWISIEKLLAVSLRKKLDIVQIKYFTALVKGTSKDPSKPERQRAYWKALRMANPKLEIIEGAFKTKNVQGKDSNGKLVRVETFVEKESDVNIASHIVFDSFRKDINCIVLLSNDSDLATPLSMARKKLRKLVIVISPHRTQERLKKIANTSIGITDDMLKKSLLPDRVGRIPKPSKW